MAEDKNNQRLTVTIFGEPDGHNEDDPTYIVNILGQDAPQQELLISTNEFKNIVDKMSAQIEEAKPANIHFENKDAIKECLEGFLNSSQVAQNAEFKEFLNKAANSFTQRNGGHQVATANQLVDPEKKDENVAVNQKDENKAVNLERGDEAANHTHEEENKEDDGGEGDKASDHINANDQPMYGMGSPAQSEDGDYRARYSAEVQELPKEDSGNEDENESEEEEDEGEDDDEEQEGEEDHHDNQGGKNIQGGVHGQGN